MSGVDCDNPRVLVSAYVDGELVGEDSEAFERHVSGCRCCRVALDRERELVELVRTAGPLQAASPELRRRVERALRPDAPRRSRRWLLAAAVLLAAAALLLSTGPRLRPLADTPASELATLGVDTHLRHVRGQLPLEVRSERTRDVAGWFRGRVPFQLELPEYPVGPGERKPYALVGARLVGFHGDYAAYVVYRMEERPISLLVTSSTAVQPNGGTTVRSGALTFHIESVAGLKVITWTDRGLTYALVSDLREDGARSCLVCHGKEQERRKLDGLDLRPLS